MEVILQLPPLVDINNILSSLGHVVFYHRVIKDLSLIARHLSNLLAKDAPFELTKE